MQVSWLTLGEGHPLDPTSNFADELVNNERAITYAGEAGIGWLLDCDPCDPMMQLTLPNAHYASPVTDPAPWYDPAHPDTAGFLGVFGIEITRAEDSTRTAKVAESIGSRGAVGASYLRTRSMVLRALVIGDNECGLAEGLRWLRERTYRPRIPCVGDKLTFYECCPTLTCRDTEPTPCPCDDMDTPGGPCWVDTYAQLKGTPSCAPTWWPNTYAELKAGPPTDDEWCHWVYTYYELRIGADAWSCGAEACIVPYLRQFDHVTITEGPTVLNRHIMSTGAFAEVEMTIVAADPIDHGLPGRG